MPRLVPASSLVSPAVSIPGSQLRAGPAEHLQPCQHQHPAAAGGAPREQHLPVPPPGSYWSEASLSVPLRLIGQRQLRPSPGVSLVSGISVPSPASHWSAAALSLPRRLIGQRQLRPLPLAEPPCAGAAVGSRQCQARLSSAKRRSGSPGRPAGERGVSRSCPGSSEPEAAAQRERVLRTAPPEVCGKTGAGEGEEPCAVPPSTLPFPPPWTPRGVGLWDWDEGCGMGRWFGTDGGLGSPSATVLLPASEQCPTPNPSSAAPGDPRPPAAKQNRG